MSGRSGLSDEATQQKVSGAMLLQQILLENRGSYGNRRGTLELRRQAIIANHKRAFRLMREDSLLAIRHRKPLPATELKEEPEVYLDLARRLKISGPNQLWIADITYLRLQREFACLPVILDAHSGRVVGWELGRPLRARLPPNALEQEVLNRQPPPDLVHHSDRGVQYTSAEYVRVLRDREMIPRMSRGPTVTPLAVGQAPLQQEW